MSSQKDSWSTERRANNLGTKDFLVCLSKKQISTQFRTITFTKSVVFHHLQHKARSVVLPGPAHSGFLRDFDSCGRGRESVHNWCNEIVWKTWTKYCGTAYFVYNQILPCVLFKINVTVCRIVVFVCRIAICECRIADCGCRIDFDQWCQPFSSSLLVLCGTNSLVR